MSCCRRRGAITLYVASGLNDQLTMSASLESGRRGRGTTHYWFCPKACSFPSGPVSTVQRRVPQLWCWIRCPWEGKQPLQRWASLLAVTNKRSFNQKPFSTILSQVRDPRRFRSVLSFFFYSQTLNKHELYFSTEAGCPSVSFHNVPVMDKETNKDVRKGDASFSTSLLVYPKHWPLLCWGPKLKVALWMQARKK